MKNTYNIYAIQSTSSEAHSLLSVCSQVVEAHHNHRHHHQIYRNRNIYLRKVKSNETQRGKTYCGKNSHDDDDDDYSPHETSSTVKSKSKKRKKLFCSPVFTWLRGL